MCGRRLVSKRPVRAERPGRAQEDRRSVGTMARVGLYYYFIAVVFFILFGDFLLFIIWRFILYFFLDLGRVRGLVAVESKRRIGSVIIRGPKMVDDTVLDRGFGTSLVRRMSVRMIRGIFGRSSVPSLIATLGAFLGYPIT